MDPFRDEPYERVRAERDDLRAQIICEKTKSRDLWLRVLAGHGRNTTVYGLLVVFGFIVGGGTALAMIDDLINIEVRNRLYTAEHNCRAERVLEDGRRYYLCAFESQHDLHAAEETP